MRDGPVIVDPADGAREVATPGYNRPGHARAGERG